MNDQVYFTIRVSEMSDTNPTQVRHEQHECDTSARRTTRVRHKYYTNDTSATRVKNFDNGTSENIFSHPYIYYVKSERLQGEEKFHSKNCILEMPPSHAKMRLKR